MEESIFTKIVKGEVPCHKVYEDDRTLAFLTIGPIAPGHTLVIPKKQVQFLWDLDDDEYQAVMATAKKVARRIKEVLQPRYVGEHVAGEEVPHAHVHLFPFNNSEEFWKRPQTTPPPDEELAGMAARLRMEDEL